MIRFTMLGLSLLAPTAGWAQVADAPAVVPSTRSMRIAFPPEGLATIPIRQVKGIILLPARIGERQVDVVFDNGSDTTIIDEHIAQASGMKLTKAVSRLHAGAMVIPLGLAEGALTLGGSLRISGQMMEADLGRMSRALGTPVAAIIGTDVLYGITAVINPAKGWMAVALPGHMNVSMHANMNFGATKPTSEAVNALMPKLMPATIPFDERQVVKATVNGQPVDLKLDYGFNGAISLREDLWQQAIPPEDRSEEINSATMAAGNTVTGRLGTAKTLKIGTLAADNVPISSASPADLNGYQGRVGLSVLGTSVTVFSIGKRQVMIFPANQDVSVSP